MKYTNVHGIDEVIAKAVTEEPFYGAHNFDATVTQLIEPGQIAWLKQQHADELTEDVSDRLWSLLGQSVHAILAAVEVPESLPEQRLSMEVLGWLIGGKPDLYRVVDGRGVITDYKVTSVYSFLLEGGAAKQEWVEQLNMYAVLYRAAGFQVDELVVSAILRDHMRSKLGDIRYPRIPYQKVEVPVWPKLTAQGFLEHRVKEHQEAQLGKFHGCSPEERWAELPKWAVMKKGQKKALKLHLDPVGAAEHGAALATKMPQSKFYIEDRPGKNKRCEDYCPVVQWCEQAKALGVKAAGGKP